MDEQQRLEELRRQETRLDREWFIAAIYERWTEAAEIRTAYNRTFSELVALCRLLKIIE